MERLYRAGTKSSPEVDFNPSTGNLKISGHSYPENAPAFYQDLFIWLKQYLSHASNPIVMDLYIAYMNTSSTKCLLDMIDMLDIAYAAGVDITINWHYHAKNRSVKECGEELGEALNVVFNLIPDQI